MNYYEGMDAERNLNTQIDLNTTLLQRLHEIEQTQLAEQASTSEREAMLKETRELLNSLNNENSDLREELLVVRKQIIALEEETNSARGERDTAEGNLKQLNFNLLYQMKEKNLLVDNLSKEVESKEKREKEVSNSVELLASQLHQVTKERDTSKTELSEVRSTLVTLEEQCDAVILKYETHSPSRQRSGSVNQQLDSLLQNLINRIHSLEEMVRQGSQTTEASTHRTKTLTTRLETVEEAYTQSRNHAETLLREKNENAAANDRLLEETRETSHGLALELLKCRQEFVLAGEEADRNLAYYKSVLNSLVQDLLIVESHCDKAAIQVGSQQVTISQLQDCCNDNEVLRILRSTQQASKQHHSDKDQLSRNLLQLEERINVEKTKSSQAEGKLAFVTSQSGQAQHEINLLHNTISQLTSENKSLEYKLLHDEDKMNLREQLIQHRQHSTDLQSEISRLQRNEDHVRRSEVRIQQLQDSITKLTKQLQKSKEVNEVITEQRNVFKSENESLKKEVDVKLEALRTRTVKTLAESPHKRGVPASSQDGRNQQQQSKHAVYTRRVPPTPPGGGFPQQFAFNYQQQQQPLKNEYAASGYGSAASIPSLSPSPSPARTDVAPPPSTPPFAKVTSNPQQLQHQQLTFSSPTPTRSSPQAVTQFTQGLSSSPTHRRTGSSQKSSPTASEGKLKLQTGSQKYPQQMFPLSYTLEGGQAADDTDESFRIQMKELDEYSRAQQQLEARLMSTLQEMKATSG